MSVDGPSGGPVTERAGKVANGRAVVPPCGRAGLRAAKCAAGGTADSRASVPTSGPLVGCSSGQGGYHTPDPINNPTSSWGLEDGDGALDEDTAGRVGGQKGG